MLCPKCGTSVADRSRSCGSCGQTIDVDGDLTNSMRIPPGYMDVGPEGFGRLYGSRGAATLRPGLMARWKGWFSR